MLKSQRLQVIVLIVFSVFSGIVCATSFQTDRIIDIKYLFLAIISCVTLWTVLCASNEIYKKLEKLESILESKTKKGS